MIVFDLETSFIPTLTKDVEKLFCIGLKIDDTPTKCFTCKPTPYSDGTLEEAYDLLQKADLIVGHNICKFDLPMVEKFLGKLTTSIADTLIDAKLCYSKDKLIGIDSSIKEYPKALKGSYSLKAFGYRFGLAKIEFEDFSTLCEDMVTYCKRDVDLTYKLYKHLIALPHYPSNRVRDCEYKVARILYDQEMFGFYFDIDKAMDVASRLQWKVLNSENRLRKTFPAIYVADGEVVEPKKRRRVKLYKDKPFDSFTLLRPFNLEKNGLTIRKNGTWKFPPRSIKYTPTPHTLIYEEYSEGAPYQKIKLQRFNPNSRQQIASRLKNHFNLTIDNYTPKGNIKLNEDVLDTKIKELETCKN